MKTIPLCCVVTVTLAVMCVPTLAQTRPALPFTLSKETTVITSPLNADGTPDYIGALNERYGKGVTPENNGFVAIIRITGAENGMFGAKVHDRTLALLGIKAVPAEAARFQAFEEFLQLQNLTPQAMEEAVQEFTRSQKDAWTEERHSKLASYLRAQRGELDAIGVATMRPRWWIPTVSDDGRMLVNAMLPSLGKLRAVANALACRATLRGGSGDFKGFAQDAVALKRMARQVALGTTVIERLVGLAINSMADEAIGAVIGAGKMDAVACKALEVQLQTLPPLPLPDEAVNTGERWTHLDLLAMFAVGKITASPNSEELKTVVGLDRHEVEWDRVFRQVNAMFDEMVAALKQPTLPGIRHGFDEINMMRAQWDQESKNSATAMRKSPDESSIAYTTRFVHAFESNFFPDFGKTGEVTRKGQLLDQMTAILLAAAQVHAKTGKWPEKLSDLSPAYIKEIPRDLYPVDAPGELQYTVTPAGIRIWSIGDNNHPFGVGIQLPN